MSPDKIIEMARETLVLTPYESTTGFNAENAIKFANLVAQLEKERIATSIERLPFGDTAASFAIYVRELKDE
jgi:hypothetical protein